MTTTSSVKVRTSSLTAVGFLLKYASLTAHNKLGRPDHVFGRPDHVFGPSDHDKGPDNELGTD